MTTLSETGQIRITRAAAKRWLAAAGSEGLEAARAELLPILMDARPLDDPKAAGKTRWRARSLTHGWDVSAIVVREPEEPRVAIVVSISARPYRRRS